jgi:uncharacterized protein YlxW (UPF0749 family)
MSTHDDAVARLLESERAWSAQLEAARADADRLVADARADAERAQAELESTLPSLIETRGREIEDASGRALADTIESLRQSVALYSAASDALIASMAERTAARAPWFARADGESSGA